MKTKAEIISEFILEEKIKGVRTLSTYDISQSTNIGAEEVQDIMNKFKKEGKVKEVEREDTTGIQRKQNGDIQFI